MLRQGQVPILVLVSFWFWSVSGSGQFVQPLDFFLQPLDVGRPCPQARASTVRADDRPNPSNQAKQIGMPVQKGAINAGRPRDTAHGQRLAGIGELLDRGKDPVISAF